MDANAEIWPVNPTKIVITGGPGTGKTSVIEALELQGHYCFHEVSREVILEAQKRGIEQLFLQDPLLFSKKLLEGRIEQHLQAQKWDSEKVFLDRGVPDVVAYLDYFGTEYPSEFEKACDGHRYEQVFVLPPWRKIYTEDNERYETYDQAVAIHDKISATYQRLGYSPIEVPEGTIAERTSFILKHLE